MRIGFKLAMALVAMALLVSSCAETDQALDRMGINPPKQSLLDEAAPVGGKVDLPPDTGPTKTTASTQSTTPSLKPLTQLGNEEFTRPASPSRRARAKLAGGGLSLNFVDTDVREVIRSVLGDTLKLNYAIDPQVVGIITLQTSKPIPMTDALPTLEATLRLSGISIVEANGMYNVVPSEAAARAQIVPQLVPTREPSRDAYGVQIVPLKHISATEMADILKPFAPPEGIMRVDTRRNMLLLGGTRDERDSMSEIVQIFDVDWFSGMSFALTPLRFSEAATVVEELENLFAAPATAKQGGKSSEGGETATPGIIRFAPIERLNAVLAISANPDYVKRAKAWIARLDVGSPSKNRRLYVYAVQNGLAVDLAEMLSQIFGGTLEQVDGAQQNGTGNTQQSGQVKRLGALGSTSTSSSGTSSRLGSGSSTQALSDRFTGATGTAQDRRGSQRNSARRTIRGTSLWDDQDIRIIANDVNNSIAILATPDQYREIESSLKLLDIVPLQVLIEATIAEVRLNDQLKYGVKWFFDTGDAEFKFNDLASDTLSPIFPGFNALFSTGNSIRILLEALDSVTDVNVISSPQLMVQDNRSAELLVGDQVPVATQSSISTDSSDSRIVNSIQYLDTGVVLRVTPRVNASGLVTLEVEQEVSDVVPTTSSGIDSPTIQQRRIKSSVSVQSGGSVALGGLIRSSRSKENTGVPLLSSLPAVGALFGVKENSVEKTELLVLITPRVVRNQEEARAITRELRNRIGAFAPKDSAETAPKSGDTGAADKTENSVSTKEPAAKPAAKDEPAVEKAPVPKVESVSEVDSDIKESETAKR